MQIVIDLEKAAYKLQGRMEVQGLNISIENRKGSVRSGIDKDRHEWKTRMRHAYGYIRMSDEVRRKGSDGDHVDCFVGPALESEKVFIVHLNHADSGSYDEDKVFLFFQSKEDAMAAFKANYDKAGQKLFGGMTEMDMSAFKQRLAVRSKGMIKSLRLDSADNRPDSKYDAAQLKLGIKIEMEHTSDLAVAEKIAKDHLDEIPDYYARLGKMEAQALSQSILHCITIDED